jgi:NAD(P)-dependent dehydrogenase (short-subunit alcohol dehydrogenase family)
MSSDHPAPSGRLTGRTALVTGASKGIGLAIAAAYAREGAAVMLSSRKQAQLDDAAAGIRAATPGADVDVFAANAGDADAAEACVAATVERFGGLDILVNNAATNPSMGPTIEADLGAWDKTFQVNLRGLFVWTQLAWRARMKEHGGAVINLSSIGGLRGDASIGVYNTTKAAIIHLTKILAVDMGPQVRVNAIAPGLVKTDFARALWEDHGDLAARTLPLQRLGEPEDIAPAAVFLASDDARWVTGHTLVVDGGALAGPSVVGG